MGYKSLALLRIFVCKYQTIKNKKAYFYNWILRDVEIENVNQHVQS